MLKKYGQILNQLVKRPFTGQQEEEDDLQPVSPGLGDISLDVPLGQTRNTNMKQTVQDHYVKEANMRSMNLKERAATNEDFSALTVDGARLDTSMYTLADGSEFVPTTVNLTGNNNEDRINGMVVLENSAGKAFNVTQEPVILKHKETGDVVTAFVNRYTNPEDVYGNLEASTDAFYSNLEDTYMNIPGLSRKDAKNLVDLARLKSGKSDTYGHVGTGLSNVMVQRINEKKAFKLFDFGGESDKLRLRTDTDPYDDQVDHNRKEFFNQSFATLEGKKSVNDIRNKAIYSTGFLTQNLNNVHLIEGVGKANINKVVDRAVKSFGDNFTINNPNNDMGTRFINMLRTQEDVEVESSFTNTTGFTSSKTNEQVLYHLNDTGFFDERENIIDRFDAGDKKAALDAYDLVDKLGFIDTSNQDNVPKSMEDKELAGAMAIELLREAREGLERLNGDVQADIFGGDRIEYERYLNEAYQYRQRQERIYFQQNKNVQQQAADFLRAQPKFMSNVVELEESGGFFNPNFVTEGTLGADVQKMIGSDRTAMGLIQDITQRYPGDARAMRLHIRSLADIGYITPEAANLLSGYAGFIETRMGAVSKNLRDLRTELNFKGTEIPDAEGGKTAFGLDYGNSSYDATTSFNPKTKRYEPYYKNHGLNDESVDRYTAKANAGLVMTQHYNKVKTVLTEKFEGDEPQSFARIILNMEDERRNKLLKITEEEAALIDFDSLIPEDIVEMMEAGTSYVGNTKPESTTAEKIVKLLPNALTRATEEIVLPGKPIGDMVRESIKLRRAGANPTPGFKPGPDPDDEDSRMDIIQNLLRPRRR